MLLLLLLRRYLRQIYGAAAAYGAADWILANAAEEEPGPAHAAVAAAAKELERTYGVCPAKELALLLGDGQGPMPGRSSGCNRLERRLKE